MAITPVLVIAAQALFCQPSEQSRDPLSETWTELRDLLFTKTVDARLHRSLARKYGLTHAESHHFDEHGLFTTRSFPLVIGAAEEWPPLLGGSLHLLHEPAYSKIIETASRLRKEDAGKLTTAERVLFQGDVWAAFDSLHEHGSGALLHPLSDDINKQRWQRLLFELASLMRHVAPTSSEIQNVSLGVRLGLRARDGEVLSGNVRLIEFVSLQSPFIHDYAHGFRRVSHVYYSDALLDFTDLPRREAEKLARKSLRLSQGAYAILRENAIAITREGEMIPTEIPALVKAYQVGGRDDGSVHLTFWMFRPDSSGEILALREVPVDTEAWANIDLPNIPGHAGKLAFRAPMAFTCAGCHAAFPKAFSPHASLRLDPEYFRFSDKPQSVTADRAIQTKLYSSEYRALQTYLALREPPPPGGGRPGTLGTDESGNGYTQNRTPRDAFEGGFRYGLLAGGAFVGLILFALRINNRRRMARGAR